MCDKFPCVRAGLDTVAEQPLSRIEMNLRTPLRVEWGGLASARRLVIFGVADMLAPGGALALLSGF